MKIPHQYSALPPSFVRLRIIVLLSAELLSVMEASHFTRHFLLSKRTKSAKITCTFNSSTKFNYLARTTSKLFTNLRNYFSTISLQRTLAFLPSTFSIIFHHHRVFFFSSARGGEPKLFDISEVQALAILPIVDFTES